MDSTVIVDVVLMIHLALLLCKGNLTQCCYFQSLLLGATVDSTLTVNSWSNWEMPMMSLTVYSPLDCIHPLWLYTHPLTWMTYVGGIWKNPWRHLDCILTPWLYTTPLTWMTYVGGVWKNPWRHLDCMTVFWPPYYCYLLCRWRN
jgi:hypothetical protein